MSTQEKHFYEFGPFRLDPVKRRLLHNGEPLPLAPKAFDTLLALVQQSGKTIEKDDLMKRVWPDAVVEENNLNQNITALRKSLGDSRQESKYIATIPGFGYRFVAEVKVAPVGDVDALVDGQGQSLPVVDNKVERISDEEIEKPKTAAISAAAASPGAVTPQEVEPGQPVESLSPPVASSADSIVASLIRHRKGAVLFLVLMITAAAGVAILTYRIIGTNRAETAGGGIEVTPLTRTGTNATAAISPDGRYIVYSVIESGRQSLWIRQVAASSARQMVPPAEVGYSGLTFSLDGNHIHFLRKGPGETGLALYRMPALGGVPAKLVADIDSAISLSPDGSRMAFVRNSSDESALMIANADGSNQRKLATRPVTDYFKVPAWSPDGKLIACSSGSGEPYDIHNSVMGVNIEDGSQSPLTPQKWAWTRWVRWLADGSGILLTARDRHEAPDQIWHISYPGGVARRLTGDSRMYLSLSLTADSRSMVAVQTDLLSDIWVMPGRDSSQARKLTFGTGSYGDVCYTPDGRIVYSSQASGNWDLWIMDSDGGNPRQLTADAGINAHQTVSPDGRYIVFASNRAGVFNIWRINTDGSNPVQLTRGSGEKFPHCSPAGKWIVYNSVASDQNYYALWKMPIDGGEPVQLTDGHTEHPAISPDGNSIAYFRDEESPNTRPRIEIIPLEGGQPVRSFDVAPSLEPLTSVHWQPDGQALTYSAVVNGVSNIWMQPLAGANAKQLTDFKAEGRIAFDWSHDGRQLVFLRRFWTFDLVLLRNFVPGKNLRAGA